MDLALNSLQRLICHETQTNKQTNSPLFILLHREELLVTHARFFWVIALIFSVMARENPFLTIFTKAMSFKDFDQNLIPLLKCLQIELLQFLEQSWKTLFRNIVTL